MNCCAMIFHRLQSLILEYILQVIIYNRLNNKYIAKSYPFICYFTPLRDPSELNISYHSPTLSAPDCDTPN